MGDGAPEGSCVQWDVGCQYVEYLEEGEPRMSNGSCTSLGFDVKGNSSTETSPWTGDIIITTYTRAVNRTIDRICSLHGMNGAPEGSCVQWDVGCQNVQYMEDGEPRMS